MSTGSKVEQTLSDSRPVIPAENHESNRSSTELHLPTPSEIAQIAESYDDEDWFEFLDQMDEVYRRRRQRDIKPDLPAGTDRRAVVDWIARKHLLIDRTIREILFLPTDSPQDEIHLIEVNDRLDGPDDMTLRPLEYVVDTVENPFRVMVADVNRDELEAIKLGRMKLPIGWKWEENEMISYARRHVS
jgi:hypothetical protein